MSHYTDNNRHRLQNSCALATVHTDSHSEDIRLWQIWSKHVYGFRIWKQQTDKTPVPVAARSKAQVCDRSPTEIVGSNPAGGIDSCQLRVLGVVR